MLPQPLGSLTISVQGVESLMGHATSPAGKSILPSDDFDVTRRFGRGGSGQCGVELTKRSDAP